MKITALKPCGNGHEFHEVFRIESRDLKKNYKEKKKHTEALR